MITAISFSYNRTTTHLWNQTQIMSAIKYLLKPQNSPIFLTISWRPANKTLLSEHEVVSTAKWSCGPSQFQVTTLTVLDKTEAMPRNSYAFLRLIYSAPVLLSSQTKRVCTCLASPLDHSTMDWRVPTTDLWAVKGIRHTAGSAMVAR